MPPFRQPDDFQVQEELALYSTLCLLEAQAGEGAKQVELHRNMFRKHNLKAFEYILHHAYSVVKGRAAAKKVSTLCSHSSFVLCCAKPQQ